MRKFFIPFILISLFVLPVQTFAAINNDILYSVVQIYSYKEYNGEYLWMTGGSGSIISEDGIILTNYHVVSDENGDPYDDFEICYTIDEYELPYCDEYAYVIAYQADLDLAILYPYVRYNYDTSEWDYIPEDDTAYYPPVTFSTVTYDDLDLPALRDEVSIVGYPASSLTGNINVTMGQITSYESLYVNEEEGNVVFRMETDSLVNPGNSGGAAFDVNDRFVGIPTEISLEGVSRQYGYIIPVTLVNMWLDSLVEDGTLNFNPNQYVYGDAQIALENALADGGTSSNLADLSMLEGGQQLFFDVDESNVNYDAIKYLKENKIISGYLDGTFKPEGDITRAELMKILVLSTGAEIDATQYNNCFPDVADDWYAKYVCYAKEKGWVQGYPDNTFKPGNNVIKPEAIKMILNTQGVILETNVAENPFSDVPKNQWYAVYVQTAKNLGVLEESGILYHPTDNATRAGVAENIYRVLK